MDVFGNEQVGFIAAICHEQARYCPHGGNMALVINWFCAVVCRITKFLKPTTNYHHAAVKCICYYRVMVGTECDTIFIVTEHHCKHFSNF